MVTPRRASDSAKPPSTPATGAAGSSSKGGLSLGGADLLKQLTGVKLKATPSKDSDTRGVLGQAADSASALVAELAGAMARRRSSMQGDELKRTLRDDDDDESDDEWK